MNEIATNKDPMAGFQEKVKAKLRDTIAEMLPEEAIAALMNKAVEETFFQPRVVKTDNWGGKTEAPSWFVAQVAESAKPLLSAAVDKFIGENRAAIDKAIAEFLTANTLALHLSDKLGRVMAEAFEWHARELINRR